MRFEKLGSDAKINKISFCSITILNNSLIFLKSCIISKQNEELMNQNVLGIFNQNGNKTGIIDCVVF